MKNRYLLAEVVSDEVYWLIFEPVSGVGPEVLQHLSRIPQETVVNLKLTRLVRTLHQYSLLILTLDIVKYE